MQLRSGRTKNLLQSSIDAALLAVEIYNKPRTVFRSQNYVSLMVMAWTYLFHAYFNRLIGQRYCYKSKNGRFEIVDGERKTWDLTTCINKYGSLDEPVKATLLFIIGLRNKIEHRCVTDRSLDAGIFGECQALLYNYEVLLTALFGEGYALNENLVYSLQFSRTRTDWQRMANRSILQPDVREIKRYVEDYRTNLSPDVFNSQSYSVKLIQVPKVSNTNRNDLAIEFVNWNQISPEDREKYERLTAIIKEKVVPKEVLNLKRLRPTDVTNRIKEQAGINIGTNFHMRLCMAFGIRPKRGSEKPSETNTQYCLFDQTHQDYVYEERWAEFLVAAFKSGRLNMNAVSAACTEGRVLSMEDFQINAPLSM